MWGDIIIVGRNQLVSVENTQMFGNSDIAKFPTPKSLQLLQSETEQRVHDDLLCPDVGRRCGVYLLCAVHCGP